jgi:hypothetical protein
LEAAGVETVRSVQVTSVSCTDGRVSEIGLEHSELDPDSDEWVGAGEGWTEEVDELILAVPALKLLDLVRAGEPGHRIVDLAPEIAELSRLRAQQIPIINLYFTRKLPHIPAEPVGLFDSRYALAFTDISQTWEGVPGFADHTVLAVSASDLYGLPGTAPSDDAQAMLAELAEYLEFDPGTAWGDSTDIDWERTRYDTNADATLFLNETGTDAWRPGATSAAISNLSFAGDFCRNRIGMTTIESAVTTGLEAAQAIVERRGIGAPVEIIEPDSLPGALYVWLRYAWAPYAFAGKAWSTGSDLMRSIRPRMTGAQSVLRYLLKTSPRGAQRRDS